MCNVVYLVHINIDITLFKRVDYSGTVCNVEGNRLRSTTRERQAVGNMLCHIRLLYSTAGV